MMNRVEEIIKEYGLLPHPEGGWYKETYRSEKKIEELNRNLMTSIYFLITSENISKLHQIKSDEHWYFHEGTGLRIHMFDQDYSYIDLGLNTGKNQVPFATVGAQIIFGSSVEQPGGYAFVSCAVAPGFDFEDFRMLGTNEMLEKYPSHADLINRLT